MQVYPNMSKEAFIKAHVGSKVLAQSVVVKCDCGHSVCSGWKFVSREVFDFGNSDFENRYESGQLSQEELAQA